MFETLKNLGARKDSATLIEGAIGMFTNALADLEQGIQEGQDEITTKKDDLEEKRTEFLNTEMRINNKIDIVKADITRAGKISTNIKALLD